MQASLNTSWQLQLPEASGVICESHPEEEKKLVSPSKQDNSTHRSLCNISVFCFSRSRSFSSCSWQMAGVSLYFGRAPSDKSKIKSRWKKNLMCFSHGCTRLDWCLTRARAFWPISWFNLELPRGVHAEKYCPYVIHLQFDDQLQSKQEHWSEASGWNSCSSDIPAPCSILEKLEPFSTVFVEIMENHIFQMAQEFRH